MDRITSAWYSANRTSSVLFQSKILWMEYEESSNDAANCEIHSKTDENTFGGENYVHSIFDFLSIEKIFVEMKNRRMTIFKIHSKTREDNYIDG